MEAYLKICFDEEIIQPYITNIWNGFYHYSALVGFEYNFFHV